jgi:nicotinamide-nucleotide amidase
MDAVTADAAPAPFRRAEIIAVGSELLMPPRLDTNSLTITEHLNALGIPVMAKAIVGDRIDDVAALVAAAAARADLVLVTGGLGPTDDDVTRDAVARVLGRAMQEHAPIVEKLRARFASRGLEMPEINRRQAMVMAGAVVLDNVTGTAPGQWIEHDRGVNGGVDGGVIVLLPGPPRELLPMLQGLVDGPLGARSGEIRLLRRSIFITGMTESHAEEALLPCYERWRQLPLPIEATILAAPGQIELHLIVRASHGQGTPVLDAAVVDVERALGERVFSTSGQRLEEVVGGLLAARGWRIALAESCTGGLTASRLTDVPGSSSYVEAGVVAYSNVAKTLLADVPAALIAEHGAVSEPVAAAMAEGVRARAGVDLGLGITGIAGPSGGSEAKPVGTVAIALSVVGMETRVRTFRFPGGRAQVKFFASQSALDMVRRALIHDRTASAGGDQWTVSSQRPADAAATPRPSGEGASAPSSTP